MTSFFRLLLVYGTSITTSLAMLWIQPSRFAGAAAATDYVTSWSGGVLQEKNSQRGFKFTVGGSPITVTEVGIWGNASHYSASMTVYIRASDGTDLGNASITWGTASQWYWAALSSPVVLSASTTYFIMSADMGYNFINRDFVPTVTGAATYNNGAQDQPPVDSGFSVTEAALNFKYHF